MTSQTPFRIAIVGDGSTAVNALDALVDDLIRNPRPIEIDVYGRNPEEHFGKGFAYGPIGSRFGNLTEPVSGGHADYTATKGAFAAFRDNHAPPAQAEDQRASRQSIGAFHHQRYQNLKQTAADHGIPLQFHQAEVTDIVGTAGQRQLVTENGQTTQPYDHVTLAVGDVLSQRLRSAADKFPGKVKPTPYHGLDEILDNSGPKTVVAALGTRSSFTDLANGLLAEGFEGKIIGVSTSGQTSWPTTDNPDARHQPRFLTGDKSYRTVNGVLNDLRDELSSGMRTGGVTYVPEGLMASLQAESGKTSPQRLRFAFDPVAERDHAGQRTYHQVVQGVDWERIYDKLPTGEQPKFIECLGDFITWNRVNRIEAGDFATLVGHIESGKVEIRTGSIEANNIRTTAQGKLGIDIGNQNLAADYLVNCAIGPALSSEQVTNNPLIGNLVKSRILTPHQKGTGFDIADTDRNDIAILGAQARRHSFSGLGIETYGRQITQQWLPDLNHKLEQKIESTPDTKPVPRYAQTNTPRYRRS